MSEELLKALIAGLDEKIDRLDARLEKLSGCVASLKSYKSWLTGAIAVLGGMGILGGCGAVIASLAGKL